jgi:hypothetical protein
MMKVFGGILMKVFLKFLSISIILMTLFSCGTDEIIVPDDDDNKSGNIIYVSPADGVVTSAENEKTL